MYNNGESGVNRNALGKTHKKKVFFFIGCSLHVVNVVVVVGWINDVPFYVGHGMLLMLLLL